MRGCGNQKWVNILFKYLSKTFLSSLLFFLDCFVKFFFSRLCIISYFLISSDSKTHMDSNRPGDGGAPNIKELTMPTKGPTARDKRCEVGLRMCQKNEECVPFGEKRRDGSCQCISGYHLNEKTDECVREASLADAKSTTTTVAPSAEAGTKANASVSAVGSPSSSPPDKGAANTSSNTPSAIASTPSPGSLSPKPVEKLVVSINNKTVYLPAGSTVYDKRVTLSAYAIGGKLKV